MTSAQDTTTLTGRILIQIGRTCGELGTVAGVAGLAVGLGVAGVEVTGVIPGLGSTVVLEAAPGAELLLLLLCPCKGVFMLQQKCPDHSLNLKIIFGAHMQTL